MSQLSPALIDKYDHLRQVIADYDSVIVAFSGGVDSSLVARVAGDVLGDNALAVTSASNSLKRRDLALTERLAADWGIRHRIVVTDELSKSDYRKNPINRCFHCKTSLYETLKEVAIEEGVKEILNGTNLDDAGDHRPGLIAAENHLVRSPLIEAGFHKADIRALAEHLGMENAQKPQAACLSSRFPYGTAITEALLAQVEGAEEVLAELGLTQFRVRHHDTVARIEAPVEAFPTILEHREAIDARFKALGYRYVAMDLNGFRSGSLNDVLTKKDVQTFTP